MPAEDAGCQVVTVETPTGVSGVPCSVSSASASAGSSGAGSAVWDARLAWAARSIASSCCDSGVSLLAPPKPPSIQVRISTITTTAAAKVPAMICQRRFCVSGSGSEYGSGYGAAYAAPAEPSTAPPTDGTPAGPGPTGRVTRAARTGPPTRSATMDLTVAAELTDDPSSVRIASTADSGETPAPTTVGSRTSSSSPLGASPGRPSAGSCRSDPSGRGSGHVPVSSA